MGLFVVGVRLPDAFGDGRSMVTLAVGGLPLLGRFRLTRGKTSSSHRPTSESSSPILPVRAELRVVSSSSVEEVIRGRPDKTGSESNLLIGRAAPNGSSGDIVSSITTTWDGSPTRPTCVRRDAADVSGDGARFFFGTAGVGGGSSEWLESRCCSLACAAVAGVELGEGPRRGLPVDWVSKETLFFFFFGVPGGQAGCGGVVNVEVKDGLDLVLVAQREETGGACCDQGWLCIWFASSFEASVKESCLAGDADVSGDNRVGSDGGDALGP
ncbi:hypothetical protein FQA39_LY09454 [Lamprigera yunnana]|nr:hypothetical protein FQA39_LY09454 [Lamprigera yunnana]